MKKFFVISISILYTLSQSFGAAEGATSQEMITKLIECLNDQQTSLNNELQNTDSEKETSKYRLLSTEKNTFDRALQSVRSVELFVQKEDLSNAIQYLSRVQLPPSATECVGVQSALNEVIVQELEAQKDFYTEKMEALKKKVGEQLLSAEKLSDLDALFVEVSDFNAQLSKSQYRSDYSNDLNNMTRIISQWQEYLAYMKAGDSRKALSAVNNIVNYSVNTPIIPRSSLIKLKLELEGIDVNSNNNRSAPHSVDDVFAAIDGVNDLAKLKEALVELKNYNDTRNDAQNLLSAVYKLERALDLIKTDNALIAFTVLDDINTSYNRLELMGTLKSQVATLALSGAIPEQYKDRIVDRSLVESLKSVAAGMRDDQEWLTLWELFKVIDVYFKRQGEQVIASLDNDINAIESYINAKSLEESGKLANALSAYERVLSRTGVYGPYDAAKEAIRSLREDRIEELFIDQRKEADTPRAMAVVDPRMAYRGRPMDISDPMLNERIESIIATEVDKKITMYLAAEKEKAAKKTEASDK